MTSDLISQICREDGGGKSPAAIRRDATLKGQRPQKSPFATKPCVDRRIGEAMPWCIERLFKYFSISSSASVFDMTSKHSKLFCSKRPLLRCEVHCGFNVLDDATMFKSAVTANVKHRSQSGRLQTTWYYDGVRTLQTISCLSPPHKCNIQGRTKPFITRVLVQLCSYQLHNVNQSLPELILIMQPGTGQPQTHWDTFPLNVIS